MRSSKRHKQSGGFVRSLTLLGLVIGPATAIASCGSGGTAGIGEDVGQEALAQIACGGSTGGSISRGGSIGLGGSVSRGGTGGSGACPTDDCTKFTCESGKCAIASAKKPEETCVDANSDRGRCANVDFDGDRRPDFTQCCVDGCLNGSLVCVPFGSQSDAACGRSGSECSDCGECRACGVSGTCVATSGSCTGGQCLGGNCCTGCISGGTCFVDAAANCGANGGSCMSCDDGNSCTTDSCSNGSCQHTSLSGGCNDGDECTVNDTCSDSTCRGTPKDCDDQNLCTMDGCDAQDGCTHVPVARDCTDGNACTVGDSCSNGACRGTMLNCDDGNPCTTDSCNPQSGCQHTPRTDTMPCAPDTACSSGFRCVDHDMNSDTAPVCRPSSGLNCEDGNPCTSDAPDCTAMPASCPHAPVTGPCSTGNLCRIGQTCEGGTCGAGMAIDCDDENPCTLDECDEATGCTHVPDDAGACNDGNPCTTDDACTNGQCVGEPVECVAIDDCHDVGDCDADTGTCTDPRKPNGAECGRTGTCQSGRCEGDGVVDPTGGTGPGTAGGGPGGNDTGGTGTSGAAGEGTGGGGNTSGGGSAGDFTDTPVFKREPGGCACRVPTTPAGGDYGALAAATALALALGRRRRAA